MKKKTYLTTNRQYVFGILAVCTVYALLRIVAATDGNTGSLDNQPVASPLFYALYCAAAGVILCLVSLLAEKRKKAPVMELLPFVLISALGLCRVYETTDKFPFTAAVVYLIILAATVFTMLTDLHFIGIAAIIGIYLVSPTFIFAAAIPLAGLIVPYLFVKDEKQQKLALLSLSLTCTLTLVFGLLYLISNGFSPAMLSASSLVILQIFMLPWLGLWIYRAYKAADRKSRPVCIFLALTPVAAALTTLLWAEALPSMYGVITAIAFSALLLFYYSDSDTAVKGTVKAFCENRILYFLALAFIARATAFIYIFFTNE